jgi:hypothetical protein
MYDLMLERRAILAGLNEGMAFNEARIHGQVTIANEQRRRREHPDVVPTDPPMMSSQEMADAIQQVMSSLHLSDPPA